MEPLRFGLVCLLFFYGTFFGMAQTVLGPAPIHFRYSVNLNEVNNDKLKVRLVLPPLNRSEIKFLMPKIVPGTYSIYNFGRFISEFRAYDNSGKELKVEHPDTNVWLITNAKALSEITYYAEDTWDTEIKENYIFEPAGTNIEAGKNFMFNHQGFFGYLEGMKFSSYTIAITRPADFYGATGISRIKSSAVTDTFFLRSYDELIDSPIMYAKPDTATLMVSNARVLVSVYSPNKMIVAKQVAAELKATLMAQKDYLGGELPVDKYAFIFYFSDKQDGGSGATGALEHCNSSVYFLPEMDFETLKQTLRDVTAHEFFHIITPLTIHSEEIGDFSFNDPKMSEHLWLYEGATEYAASHVQVLGQLITFDEFLEVIHRKMTGADQYTDDLPFTVMSKEVLTTYQKEYGNVYQKGALISMCLDIQLRYYSEGKYGLQQLMRDLGKKYGKYVSFKDSELFSVIEQMTFSEIGEFLRKHVGGKQSLPFEETLAMVGILYYPKITTKGYSYGGMDIGFNQESGRLVVVNAENMDPFGKLLGFQEGDELFAFNGSQLTLNNVRDVLTHYMSNAKEGKKLKVVVYRKEGDRMRKVKLKTKIRQVELSEKHIILLSKTPSPKQLKIRRAWIGDVK